MPRLRFLSLVAAAVACDTTTSGPSQPGVVAVGDDFFSPATVHPAPSGIVTWVWGGQRSHDLVFTDGIGSVTTPVSSGVYQRDFSGSADGTYNYRCTLHQGMTGRVVVP